MSSISAAATSASRVYQQDNPVAKTTSAPFPLGQLDSKILDSFYPHIMGEVKKEFVLQDDGRTRRNTREYGYSFFKMEAGKFEFNPPPEFLNVLGSEICMALGHPPQKFTNIILSCYEKEFHLEPHFDTNSTDPHKGYYFDENVYGIIVEADPTGHLYFVQYEGGPTPPLDLEVVYSLQEKPGTIFCLQGDYRRIPFFHGVSHVSNRRLSITFRTVNIESPTQ